MIGSRPRALVAVAPLVLCFSCGNLGTPSDDPAPFAVIGLSTGSAVGSPPSFRAVGRGYEGHSPDGRMIAQADALGFAVKDAAGAWAVRFETDAVRCGETRIAPQAGTVQATERLVMDRRFGAVAVQEWLRQARGGFEQGYDVPRNPCGEDVSSWAIEIAVGGLSAVQDGAGLTLRDAQGTAQAWYAGLHAQDATGKALPTHLGVGRDGHIELRVETRDAQWPVVVDPIVTSQPPELTVSNGMPGDGFGSSASMNLTSALVGAPGRTVGANSGQGMAYVFAPVGTGWYQDGLAWSAADGAASDTFGYAVAIGQDTALVGAPGKTVAGQAQRGAVYVFARTGSTWAQQGDALTVSDGAASDMLGASVALNGTWAIVGAPGKVVAGKAGQGAAYLFVQSGLAWAQFGGALEASDGVAADAFGSAVAVNGTTVIVGAPNKKVGPIAEQGAAYMFRKSGGAWIQEGGALTAADGGISDFFGRSVGLNATTAVIGAPGRSVTGKPGQGGIYTFTRSGVAWAQYGAAIVPGDGAANDGIGTSVAVSGAAAMVGAPGKMVNGQDKQGAAYIYVQQGDRWLQQGDAITGLAPAPEDGFGTAAAMSGKRAMLGAPNKAIGPNAGQGAAFAIEILGLMGSACTGDGECADGYGCMKSTCSPQCQVCTGTDPSTCSAISGTQCNDGTACTQTDTCQNGMCIGDNPQMCECSVGGICDALTGACSGVWVADGTTCSAGACQGGMCLPLPEGGIDAADPDASDAEASDDAAPDAAESSGEDAGEEADADLPDGEEASVPDAQAEAGVDAEGSDTGAGGDLFGTTGGAPRKDSGCSCRSVGSEGARLPWFAVLGVAGVVLARRRSRQR